MVWLRVLGIFFGQKFLYSIILFEEIIQDRDMNEIRVTFISYIMLGKFYYL